LQLDDFTSFLVVNESAITGEFLLQSPVQLLLTIV